MIPLAVAHALYPANLENRFPDGPDRRLVLDEEAQGRDVADSPDESPDRPRALDAEPSHRRAVAEHRVLRAVPLPFSPV